MEQIRPLKRSLVGFEVELFTIDRSGRMVNGADLLLKKSRKNGNVLTLKKECAHNMIEIASYPNEMVPNTMGHLLDELEHIIEIAEKNNMLLCPLATYPGNFNPLMRNDKQYQIQESIFGKNRFKIAGKCIGFHCHYTLPRGIFDTELRVLKMLVRSKIKNSLVNSYNFLVAADPALTTFMQSSPFYNGKYLGKDSRVIMYRGGDALGNKNGLYANHEEFGGLPPYKLTALDIMDIVTTRYENWKAHIKRLGLNIKILPLYGSILDTTWNPIKVNPNGTLEQRGMDMNHPVYITGVGIIIKYILMKLQQEYYAVVPSEIGIKEPFKVEKDVIYIPPYPFVKNELQKLAAYEGLENELVHNYCKRLLRFAQSVVPKEGGRLLNPLKEMMTKRKTVSDNILDFARKKGFKRKDAITNKIACEIALEHSSKLAKEIDYTRDLIKTLTS